MRKRAALAPSAESVGHDSPADLAWRIGQLRIYQDYERAFVKTTKVPLELYSIDTCHGAHRIRSGDTNPVCSILTETNKTCSLCLKVREKLTDVLETETMTCFAGLTCTRVPLKFDERVIGLLQTGQVFVGAPSAERFKTIANQVTRLQMNLNLQRLEDAYFRCRAVSADLYGAIIRLLEIFAEHLSLIVNQIALSEGSGDSRIVSLAKHYVADHKFDQIRLEQIAQALHVSTFHFCRKFKSETGFTFVEYLSRVRVEHAKLLLQNKNLRVTEVAYEVGFQSLAHFNRTFRKLVGASPTEYRSRVSGCTEEVIHNQPT